MPIILLKTDALKLKNTLKKDPHIGGEYIVHPLGRKGRIHFERT